MSNPEFGELYAGSPPPPESSNPVRELYVRTRGLEKLSMLEPRSLELLPPAGIEPWVRKLHAPSNFKE